jgi:hypothetical protein
MGKLRNILSALSISFTSPVLVGALWWVGSAGLTFPVVATRRGESARLNGAGTTGGCSSGKARRGCSGTANVDAEAVMPD